MNKSSQSKDSNEMTVDVAWIEKYEKKFQYLKATY